MFEKKQPVFHKTKARFDEMMMEYSTDQLSVDFFGDNLNFAKDLINEINNKCNKFYEFKYYLKYRVYTITSMFFVLPLMFFLGVIGFTSEAFILSWFFFAFLFFSMFSFFLVLYYLSGKIMKQFIQYSQNIQEIIDRYNIEWFIDRKLFVYFRTKSIDFNQISEKNMQNQEKIKGNSQEISLKLKFYVQSRVLRIIRSFFWIEFLSFGENQGNLGKKFEKIPIFKPNYQGNSQKSSNIIQSIENSNIKQSIQNSALKQSLQNSALKQSLQNSSLKNSALKPAQLSQNSSVRKSQNPSNLNNSKEKSMYKTPERKIEEDDGNDEIIEKKPKNSESPMKFEESSDGKSHMNIAAEGVGAKKYFNEEERIKGEAEEDEEATGYRKKSEKKEEKDEEFDF